MGYKKTAKITENKFESALSDFDWWKTRWPVEPWGENLYKAGIHYEAVALWFGEQKDKKDELGNVVRPARFVADFITKENGVVKITVPGPWRKEWIKDKYKNELKTAFPEGFEIVVDKSMRGWG